MSEQQAPKIEFPCENYPVKIIGNNDAGFVDEMLAIVCNHCPGFDVRQWEQQPSSNGRFVSLRVRITASGEEQLRNLHEALRKTGKVHMVL